MRQIIAPLLITAFTASASAQQLTGAARWADSAARIIDEATLGNPRASLDSAMVLLDRALTLSPKDYLLLHYKGYALYRAGGEKMRGDDKAGASKQLKEADALLEQSASIHPIAETYAVQSSIQGYLASLEPGQAMFYGMASGRLQSKADQLGPNNPRVAYIRGVGALFGPPEYTGGPKEAVKQLKRAHDLFATDKPAPPLPSWGRAETNAFLAWALHQTGDDAGARVAANEALALVPEYGFVKYKILPMLGAKP